MRMRWAGRVIAPLAVLASKAYYGNNKTFVGLTLVLAALSDTDRPPYLVRAQVALVYFGAALNKLLDQCLK